MEVIMLDPEKVICYKEHGINVFGKWRLIFQDTFDMTR